MEVGYRPLHDSAGVLVKLPGFAAAPGRHVFFRLSFWVGLGRLKDLAMA